MPDLTPYHLTFRGGLHVGQGADNLNATRVTVPSDTLYAALVDQHRHLGGDPEAFVAPFREGQAPFRLTSAFPYAGEVRFYPMPADLAAVFSPETLARASAQKRLRRLRFLSEGLLRRLLQGQRLDAYLPEEGAEGPGRTLQDGALWLTAEEVEKLPEAPPERGGKRAPRRLTHLWREQTVPRVTLDRLSSASTYFQVDRVRFAPGCGLWFGVCGDTERVEPLLLALGESGLGGERSAGYGAFTWQRRERLTFPETEGALCLLSRYLPAEAELPAALEGAAYRLEPVAGWLRSPDGPARRRRRLWLLAEGSLVRPPVSGTLEDVGPVDREDKKTPLLPHPVWRFGLALGLNLPTAEASHG